MAQRLKTGWGEWGGLSSCQTPSQCPHITYWGPQRRHLQTNWQVLLSRTWIFQIVLFTLQKTIYQIMKIYTQDTAFTFRSVILLTLASRKKRVWIAVQIEHPPSVEEMLLQIISLSLWILFMWILWCKIGFVHLSTQQHQKVWEMFSFLNTILFWGIVSSLFKYYLKYDLQSGVLRSVCVFHTVIRPPLTHVYILTHTSVNIHTNALLLCNYLKTTWSNNCFSEQTLWVFVA